MLLKWEACVAAADATLGGRFCRLRTMIQGVDPITEAMVPMLKNLRGASEFVVLADVIQGLSKRRELILVPSPGNWGDGLINAGTKQFLEVNGFAPRVLRRDEFLDASRVDKSIKKSVVLVGGGGGWCRNWRSTRDFADEISVLAHNVVVLPTTYELPVDESRKSNVTYFRRDNGGSMAVAPNSTFCHDMAFFLQVENLEIEEPAWRIKVFRVDKERSRQAHSIEPSVDISMLGNSFHGIQPLFQILSRFAVIHTDRMHVAIAGAMLGKRSVLLPGNYPKSEDLWQSSLRPFYANAKFKQWVDYKPD